MAAVSAEPAARFRNVLRSAGFAATAENLPMEVEGRSRGGRNIARVMRMTAAGRPLDTFVRLFLLGVPAGLREARAAMAPVPLEEWVEAGLVQADGDSVSGLVALYPYEDLILAADKPELLDRGAGSDIVSGVTNSTVSLALFMVRRRFRHILDLGAGCGVMGFVAARAGGRLLATGDAFDPAAGRKLDLMLANPPFVIGPGVRYVTATAAWSWTASAARSLARRRNSSRKEVSFSAPPNGPTSRAWTGKSAWPGGSAIPGATRWSCACEPRTLWSTPKRRFTRPTSSIPKCKPGCMANTPITSSGCMWLPFPRA